MVQQLEGSKLQLEECIAAVFKHRQQIREMDKQITELLQADIVNKCVYERDQWEMWSNVETERRNISQFEEEKQQGAVLLERAKRKQEAHLTKITSEISSTRSQQQELLQEEATL